MTGFQQKGLLFLCFHSRYQRQYSLKAGISRPIATLGLVGTWIGDGVGIPDVADNFCNFALVKVLKR
uniref:Phosphoenolpyruvate carboxylase n=1 Tax=Loa loa TaxID=7209 RepID=A0A1I7VIX2_LOALO